MIESRGEHPKRRRNLRLRDFDYSGQGPYFVTICVKDRVGLFGNVDGDAMTLGPMGWAVQTVWASLPTHYPLVVLDAFVVMPNHVHGILWLAEDLESAQATRDEIEELPATGHEAPMVGAGFKPALSGIERGMSGTEAGLKPAPTGCSGSIDEPQNRLEIRRHALPEIIRAFKTFSARRINRLRGTPGCTVWQRNYYEHVIRNAAALDRIRHYILENPVRWAVDRENPMATHPEGKDAWMEGPQ